VINFYSVRNPPDFLSAVVCQFAFVGLLNATFLTMTIRPRREQGIGPERLPGAHDDMQSIHPF
jgi:hypothetical protein